MATPPANTLVLFDIDGTLVRRAGPHHREALEIAVHRITGIHASTNGVPTHGMLDPDILTLMMQRAGIPPESISESMPAILREAQQAYLRGGPDLLHALCPGLPALLDELAAAGTPLGLVTGNLEQIAWEKLRRARLERYFGFGAFAGMAPTRGELARLAVERAKADARVGDGAAICLIGDSPNDVIAAREAGVRSIAVATGISTRAELEATLPDLLIEDLTCLYPRDLMQTVRKLL